MKFQSQRKGGPGIYVGPPRRRESKIYELTYRVLFNRRSLSLLDQAVLSATNMVTSVTIGRFCSKTQLGLYSAGFSLILLATAIQSALIAVPYTVSRPQVSNEEQPRYKGSTILQQGALSLVGTLVFLVLGLFTSDRNDSGMRLIFLTLSTVSAMVCFRDLARRISYAELQFGFAVVIDATLTVVQLVTIGLLGWWHQLTAARALVGMGLASTCASVLWVAVNWKTISLSFSQAIRGFRINWGLGKWLLSSSVLWSLCIEQYPWLITTLKAPAETAIWASCFGVMAFLNPVVLAVSNDAGPRISHDYGNFGVAGLSRSVMRSAAAAAMITAPILVFLLLFGTELVRLMYGAKYGGVGTIVSLLAFGVWFQAIGISFPYGVLALKRPRTDLLVNVACVACFLLVGIGLIRSHGVYGAAWSFIMVQSVGLVLRIATFHWTVRRAKLSRMVVGEANTSMEHEGNADFAMSQTD